MNLKRFEYLNKDVPFLKRDIALRLVFALLYFVIFVWQFASLIVKSINKIIISTPMIISTIFVLLVALLFCGLALLYCFKSFKVLSVVKKEGRCVSSVEILFKIPLVINSITHFITKIKLNDLLNLAVIQKSFIWMKFELT